TIFGGQKQLRAWAPIEDTEWGVIVDIPGTAVDGPIDAEAQRRSATAAATGAVAFLLLAILWRRLAGQIGALQVAAAQWSAGNWQHRVKIRGADEFGRLARAFETMADDRARAEAV